MFPLALKWNTPLGCLKILSTRKNKKQNKKQNIFLSLKNNKQGGLEDVHKDVVNPKPYRKRKVLILVL